MTIKSYSYDEKLNRPRKANTLDRNEYYIYAPVQYVMDISCQKTGDQTDLLPRSKY